MNRPWWKEPTGGQWCSFAAAWLGWVLDAFDFTVFLLVMPAIAREFGVSMTRAAGSITLTLLVRLLGGAAAGAAADRWGRKLPLMISVVWFALCDGSVALAPSFGWVLALRTLFGFGMGAEWTAGATLAMENWPARSRGIASGILQGSWAIGYLLAALVSAVVLPHWGWRGMFVLAAAPALLVLPIRIWVPESPDWQRAGAAGVRVQARARELLAPAVLARLAWASVAMALGFGLYYGLTGLYPTMLVSQLGRSAAQVAKLVSLFNLGMLAGAVLCGALAARRGVGLGIGLPALLTIAVLPAYVGTWRGLLGAGAFAGGAFGAGMCGVVPLLLTSMFPAHIRARAVGIVYHAGAFLAAFVPTGVAALGERAGLPLSRAIALVAGACALALVAVLALRPRAAQPGTETGGKLDKAALAH
ncbi:MAG TPA: MFS transporter [Polyangia bacterium]|nr:MFS transporter [Polyangia bacterium]